MIRVHREDEEMTLFDQLRPRPDYAKLKWDQAADLVIEILDPNDSGPGRTGRPGGGFAEWRH